MSTMPEEKLYFIRRFDEFVPREKKKIIPRARGLYVLLKKRKGNSYRVVYVGMSDSNIHGRLNSHARSKRKRAAWDYFSIFEMWPNIPEYQIRELEGLLRHIYRKDPQANAFIIQGGFKKIRRVREPIERWKENPRAR